LDRIKMTEVYLITLNDYSISVDYNGVPDLMYKTPQVYLINAEKLSPKMKRVLLGYNGMNYDCVASQDEGYEMKASAIAINTWKGIPTEYKVVKILSYYM
jgi:hypothetical protein